MSDAFAQGLFGFVGVLVGLIVRDVAMALYLAHKKRSHELADRAEEQARARRDLFKIYADPLFEATQTFRYRLDEIINLGRARYLLASAPRNGFLEYKRISTLYRVAALLGWIRAFRRERSYLDPSVENRTASGDGILKIEGALADGQHIEAQRLEEFMRLWRVPTSAIRLGDRLRLAAKLDSLCQEFLATYECLAASDLSERLKGELVGECAKLISQRLTTEIPNELIIATTKEAVLYLGIKEAYIYRDWQAAIGDMMIRPADGGLRRFEVIGFGEFEGRYLLRSADASAELRLSTRWLDRLEAIFHDLDMGQSGIFDARRGQIRNLWQACIDLEKQLSSTK